jgi:hypothetical protein
LMDNEGFQKKAKEDTSPTKVKCIFL